MKSILTLVLSSLWLSDFAHAFNQTETKNKIKRNLSGEGQSYEDPNAVYLYTTPTPRTIENIYAPKTIALVGLQPVKVFEARAPAPPQFFYELRRANILTKPVNQPDSNLNPQELPQYRSPPSPPQPPTGIINNPGIVTSETIVSPVQHSHIIPHQRHPLYNVQASYNVQAPTYQAPKKFIYLNGKLIYEPNPSLQLQHPLASQTFYNPVQQYPASTQQLFKSPYVINYMQQHSPRTNLVPPANLPPITNNKFIPPTKSQLQDITTPSQPISNGENQQRHNDEEKPVRENEESDDNEDEKSGYNEEDSDDDESFGKYSFDYEDGDHLDFKDDDDSDRYEDEDDDDNKRGSTRYVTTKVRKYPKKKYKSNKKSEVYYSGKYDYPEKLKKKGGKNPHKMHYKSYKFSKDPIEARQSEQIPVIHKKKIFKEKWYVTKSRDD